MARKSKRQTANKRLRAGFLQRAGDDLAELVAMLRDPDDDIRETIAFELERLATTARSLSLNEVADAAIAATGRLDEGFRALNALAAALRRVSGGMPVRVIGVVSPDKHESERIRARAERFGEPILVAPAFNHLLDQVSFSDLAAVAVPFGDLELIEAVAGRVPVYVVGPAKELEPRVEAMRAGATGYLQEPFDLAPFLALVRERRELPERQALLLISPESDTRDTLEAALDKNGFDVMPADDASYLTYALDEVGPEVLVFDASLKEPSAVELVQLVRAHSRYRETPTFLLGDVDVYEAVDGGADDVLAGETDGIIKRLKARLKRHHQRGFDRDPSSGLLHRSGTMRVFDQHIENARRRGHLLTVAIVQPTGLSEATERWGHGARFAAMRLLGHTLQRYFRAGDLVGHLDQTSFLVSLPDCTIEQARVRFDQIRPRFERKVKVDRRLRELTFEIGLADTQKGLIGLAERANRELLARLEA